MPLLRVADHVADRFAWAEEGYARPVGHTVHSHPNGLRNFSCRVISKPAQATDQSDGADLLQIRSSLFPVETAGGGGRDKFGFARATHGGEVGCIGEV